MPTFEKKHLKYFNANSGAFSPVTEREATGDKSVTIDKYEKAVLFSKHPDGSYARTANDRNHTKGFNILDITTTAHQAYNLVIKHPKKGKNELRLYFNRSANFYPTQSDVWFIFTRENEPNPFIGFMPQNIFNKIFSSKTAVKTYQEMKNFDPNDSDFLDSVNDPTTIKDPKTGSRTYYERDPNVSRRALKKANYSCELDPSHTTFINEVSGKPYYEPHHLIPISKQNEFTTSLDIENNIISLCPNCHRAVHLSEKSMRKKLISNMFQKRKALLKANQIEINLEKLLEMYNVDS